MQQNPYQPPAASLEQPASIPAFWDIGTALNIGWNTFKDNAGIVLAVMLIVGGISIAFSITSNLISQFATASGDEVMILVGSVISFGISIVSFVVNTFLGLGMIKFMLNLLRSSTHGPGMPAGAEYVQPQIGDLFSCGSMLVAGLIANFLVGLGVFFGMLLLIVPGVILSLGWMFVQYLIIDRELGAIDAIKESWRITDGHKANLFLFGIVSFLLVLVGLIPCGLGLFVVGPILSIATAYIYLVISQGGSQASMM